MSMRWWERKKKKESKEKEKSRRKNRNIYRRARKIACNSLIKEAKGQEGEKKE